MEAAAAVALTAAPLVLIVAVGPYFFWMRRRRRTNPPGSHGRYILMLFAPFILMGVIVGAAAIVREEARYAVMGLASAACFIGVGLRYWNRPMPPAAR